MNSICHNLIEIHKKIDQATLQAGPHRAKNPVTLVAVSKTWPAQSIKAAYQCGQHAFGENYVQELLKKQEELSSLPIEWHFIGHLQSNKSRLIVNVVQWIHAVDSLKLAKRLSLQRDSTLSPLNICIQLNLTHERSKSGIEEGQLLPLLNAIRMLPNLRLRGLMTIPSHHQTVNEQQQTFKRLHQLLEKANQEGHQLDTLSMGMSLDFETAIQEGSTMVRIGSAIFGQRQYNRKPE